MTIDYWLSGGPANGNVTTTVGASGQLNVVPLDIHGQTVPGFPTPGNLGAGNTAHSRGHVYSESSRESRLNIETRTPTAWGEARTFFEFDFAGTNNFSQQNLVHVSNGLVPRLRLAYGTLGGFLAGQADSNFRGLRRRARDARVWRPRGASRTEVAYRRCAILCSEPWDSASSLALEAPATDVFTPAGLVETDTNVGGLPGGPGQVTSATTTGCVANGIVISATMGCTLSGDPAKNTAPDVTFASYWAQPWGHVDFRFVLRDLDFNDGRFVSKQYVGYGGGISGDVKPGWFGWKKDDIVWQFTVGQGIGRYIYDNTTLRWRPIPCSPFYAGRGTQCHCKADRGIRRRARLPAFLVAGTAVDCGVGYSYYEIPSQLIGPTQSIVSNKELMTTHVNLIWSPVSFIDAVSNICGGSGASSRT